MLQVKAFLALDALGYPFVGAAPGDVADHTLCGGFDHEARFADLTGPVGLIHEAVFDRAVYALALVVCGVVEAQEIAVSALVRGSLVSDAAYDLRNEFAGLIVF